MGVPGRIALSFLLLVALLSAACAHQGSASSATAQLRAGVEAARHSLWREARLRFQRAAALDPSDAYAHNDAAVALEANGETLKARDEYETALRLEPSNPAIQKNYTRLLERLVSEQAGDAVTTKGRD